MNTSSIPRFIQRLFRLGLVALPYASYGGMVGLMVVLIYLLQKFRRLALDRTVGSGLGAIALLLLLSCVFAENKGEAFLQLSNFFPYFLFFGALPFILRESGMMATVARDLVVTSIPLNAIALVEYLLKRPDLPTTLQQIPFVAGLRAAPHVGRAMVTFGHPNALASYLVLVLGLALGLALSGSKNRGSETPNIDEPNVYEAIGTEDRQSDGKAGIYLGVLGCLVGIFCSGSRNGLMVAIAQLLVFTLFVKLNRVVRWLGLVSVGAIATVALTLGIGGRNLLSPTVWANDPRVKVWQFGLGLVAQRPLFGWGLGNYKFQYPPDLIANQEPVQHPHNFWLLLAAEAGIPVMLGLTVLVGYVCYRAIARTLVVSENKTPVVSENNGCLSPEPAIRLGYGLSFLGCVLFSLFDVTLYDVRVNALGWVVLAGIYTLSAYRIGVPKT